MRQLVYTFIGMLVLVGSVLAGNDGPKVLKASRDTFGRSNERTRNSGANQVLYVAHASNIRTLIAFDLSGVTNRVISATFRIQSAATVEQDISLTVAPMVNTENNTAWNEGTGALGASGQNARPGEATYGWSAFPDVQWEDAEGKGQPDLSSDHLWLAPLVSNQKQRWVEGAWLEFNIKDPKLVEEIRTSTTPVLTFGLWGSAGNGLYAISSKESGKAPELILTLEKPKEAE